MTDQLTHIATSVETNDWRPLCSAPTPYFIHHDLDEVDCDECLRLRSYEDNDIDDSVTHLATEDADVLCGARAGGDLTEDVTEVDCPNCLNQLGEERAERMVTE